jgi:flagellar hook-associated protein 3 FlgL
MMDTRITPSIRERNFLENINATKARLNKAQEEISSGKRVNRLSDDPFAASQASRIASVMSANDQFIAGNELLRSKLELTDVTLQSLIQSSDSAKVLAAQALSGTTTPESRAALATALDGVRSAALSSANMQFNGAYLFSGTLTTTEPFVDSGGAVTFQGNNDPLFLRLDRSTVVKSNVTDQDLFAGPPALFSTLDALKTAIQNNDTAAIRSNLSDLETISSRINTEAAKVGNNIRSVDQINALLRDHNIALTTESSRLTDADLVKSISSLNLASQAVNVGLQAQGQIQQLSLIDFLK